MKKITLLAMLLLGLTFSSRAQYVAIPDTNFAAALNAHGFSSCLSGSNAIGWKLDTTCNKVLVDTIIFVPKLQITNISGIEHFKSIKYLYCEDNFIDSIGILPQSLIVFDCHNNRLKSLPLLPPGLITLYCDSNQLSVLPALPPVVEFLNCTDNILSTLPLLPNTISTLYCSNNFISSLPLLPNSITDFQCDNNLLTVLPNLPTSLTNLFCFQNKLTTLPTLPNTLGIIYCSNNNLTTLPTLPNSVTVLYCDNNKLTTLPTLPNSLGVLVCNDNLLNAIPALPSGLTDLYCNSNHLTILPPLPNGIFDLKCNFNKLTSIPFLPQSLAYLECKGNNIFCLPVLSGSLQTVTIDINKVKCLSRAVQLVFDSSGFALFSYPICTAGNTNGCAVAPPAHYVLIPDTNFGKWLDTAGYASCMTGNSTTGWYLDTTCSAVLTATTVQCGSCHIADLTGITYFKSLTSLYCYINDLTSLPSLPSSLNILYCNSNHLTSLPSLPTSLTQLACQVNQLTNLPSLPNSLTGLACQGNLLTGLPSLPTSLTSLSCYVNHLTSLPTLPGSLNYLNCFSNPIACLPLLPISLTFLGFDSSRVHCLSRNVTTMYVDSSFTNTVTTYPICTAGNANGCAYLHTDSIWPGDADNNKVVDNLDLLPIGLAYGKTGPVRTVASLVWVGQPSIDWTDTIPGGENDKYIDCNGDGTIDANDTVAILQNFSLTHNKRDGTDPYRSGIPSLTISFSKDTVYKGDTLTTSILLGDAGTPVNSIYGLAFTFHYDARVIDTPTAMFGFLTSFFGTSSNSIHIYKDNKTPGVVKCAITGIDHVNRGGFGTIAHHRGIITTDNINGKNLKYFINLCYISDVTAIDLHRKPIALNTGRDSMRVGFVPKANGVENITTPLYLTIQPNPATNSIRIAAASEMTDIHIYNILGEESIHLQPSHSRSTIIDVSALPAGIYIVQVTGVNGVGTQRLMIN